MVRSALEAATEKLGPPQNGKLHPRFYYPGAYGRCVVCGWGSTVRLDGEALCGQHVQERLMKGNR